VNDVLRLYTDGGCIGKNPSTEGGTWAYVGVGPGSGCVDGIYIKGSGVVTPACIGLPAVTNNYTELFAAVRGMEKMADGWDGEVLTDSYVTLCRILKHRDGKMNGIPKDLQDRVAAFKKRLGKYRVTLLQGHPTDAELRAGFGASGRPVSRWNVMCDEMCNAAAATYKETR
jgi:ribonuclease HI